MKRFAAFARDRNLIMRFIEFMPLDADRAWTRDMVVTGAEVHDRIAARWPMVPVVHERSETARKFRFADGRGEIGLISPVSQPFCGHCSRLRLTADGKLRTCLFSKEDHDLRSLCAASATDREIGDEIHRHRRTEGKRPPHQRAGLCGAFAHHGFDRRVTFRPRLSSEAASRLRDLLFSLSETMADEESIIFSLRDAERLRVQLEPILIEAIEARRKLAELEEQLAQLTERVQQSGGLMVSHEKAAKQRLERNRLVEAMQSALERIHATGCVVKDIEVGLLDFPARINGEAVYLCWRLGEDRIRFYHTQDEGFSGRKPIDPRDADYRNPIQ